MRKKFTLFILVAILLTITSVSKAQVSAYQFSQSVTAYTEIVGGTLLGNTSSDDERFIDPAFPLGGFTTTGPGFPIGFNFTYNGVVFNRFAINNNGWISLGQSALTPSTNINSTSSYTPLSSTTTITPNLLRNRIAGMGRDIQAQAGASLRIQTIGSAPNRSLVVQWKGYKRFGTAGTGDNFNFQIILNETGNTVQVKFGTMVWNTATTTSSINHVGLGGSVSTDFNNRMTTAPHNYNNSSAGTLNTSGMQNATSTIAVTAPAVGRTFTWFLTPPQDQCAQNFDGGAAMPTGWSATTAIDCATSDPWAVVNSIFDSAPNSAFVNGPNCYSEEILESRVFAIVSPTAQLSFRRNVNLETGWDGMILEIKIGAGAFQDIITAGGSFVAGGYDQVLINASPLGAVPGWTGNTGWVTTTINLPAAANGQNIVLRWRRGTDSSVGSGGAAIDNLTITGSECGNNCVVTCPANITVSNTPGQCGAIVNYAAPTTNGVCGPVTTSPASGSFFPVGTTTVTATSFAGPVCTFTVTVNDVAPPTITCPANITVNASPGVCGAVVNFAPSTSDNCPGVVVSSVPASGSVFPVGTTTVTSTATDASGNTATCSFTVTVNDTQPPSITCPANITVNNTPGTCGATVTYPNPTMTDNCLSLQAPVTTLPHGGGAITVAGNNLPGGFYFNLTNNTGSPINIPALSVRFGTFSFGVVNSPAPVSVYVTTSATTYVGNQTNPAAWTTIGTNIPVTIAGPNSEYSIFTLPGGGITLPAGATRGMYVMGTQASLVYNSSANSSFTPISNGILTLTPGQASSALFVAALSPRTPNIIVHYAGTLTQTAGLPSGSVFPVGTTTNTFQATDPSGNTASCSFTVTVNDNQAPVITCPANITVTTPIGSCTAVANYTVTATDNCPGVTTALIGGLASGSAFPLGVNTVTWRATDASGNTSQCSFTVTVLDGQLPVISQQPATITTCVGSNATFSVTASNVLSYQWQRFSGGSWSNIAGATSSTYTVNSVTTAMNTNTFRVILTGLCTTVTSNNATLFVNTLPILSLSSSIPPFLLPGQFLDITASGMPPGGSYVWLLNGNVVPGVSGNVLSGIGIDDQGSYVAVYTDPNGCTSTSAALVVSGFKSDKMWVYPNPNFGQFTVKFYNANPETATVNVYSSSGQKVYTRALTTTLPYTSIDIDLGSTVKNGVYIVELVNGGGDRVGATKVVVRPR